MLVIRNSALSRCDSLFQAGVIPLHGGDALIEILRALRSVRAIVDISEELLVRLEHAICAEIHAHLAAVEGVAVIVVEHDDDARHVGGIAIREHERIFEVAVAVATIGGAGAVGFELCHDKTITLEIITAHRGEELHEVALAVQDVILQRDVARFFEDLIERVVSGLATLGIVAVLILVDVVVNGGSLHDRDQPPFLGLGNGLLTKGNRDGIKNLAIF